MTLLLAGPIVAMLVQSASARSHPKETRSGHTGAPASYWLDLRGYDPPSEARRVKSPTLVVHGERDYQVTAEEFVRWKAALGSRPDVTSAAIRR